VKLFVYSVGCTQQKLLRFSAFRSNKSLVSSKQIDIRSEINYITV